MPKILLKIITFVNLLYTSRVIFAVLNEPTKEDMKQYHIVPIIGASVGYSLLIYFCFFTSVLWFYVERKKIYFLIKQHKILIVCLLIFIFSCLWAIDPTKSLKFSLLTIWAVFWGVLIVSEYSAKEIFLFFWLLAVVIIISDWVFITALPHYAFESDGAWRGAYGDRNISAMYANMAFGIMLVTIKYIKKLRWLSLFLALADAIFIFMSHSATGLITLVTISTVFILLPLFLFNWRLCIVFGLVGICSTVLIILMADSIPQLSNFFLVLGKSGDLSGRLEIWTAFINAMQGHILLGYGSQDLLVSTRGQVVSERYFTASGDWGARAPHNLYIAIILKYGVIGAGFIAIMVWQSIHITIQQIWSKTFIYEWHLLFIIILIIFGITLGIDNQLLLWIIFTIILVSPSNITKINSR